MMEGAAVLRNDSKEWNSRRVLNRLWREFSADGDFKSPGLKQIFQPKIHIARENKEWRSFSWGGKSNAMIKAA